MEHIIYLDNSATTKPCEKCCEYIENALKSAWGNPSSLHTLGMDAELIMNSAREAVAKTVGSRNDEIFFTSCGSESNNTVIMSALARKGFGNKVITTEIEHPSVLKTVDRLEKFGFEVVKIGCDKNGAADLERLESELDGKTVLVSVMLVNNEVGAIEPIKKIGKLVKKKSPYAYFHCDAVQGYGKLPINVNDLGVDLMSASAHKIHGPKGIGFLYCRKGVHLEPFITGGGQESGLRSGTESVPLIAGLLGAVLDLPNLKAQLGKMSEINKFAREIFLSSGFIKINSPENALPYILNISVPGYRSETLLHFLESKNIFVSSGSACAKGEASYVLSAMGISKTDADSALRLSFSRYTTKEDIDFTLSALKEAVSRLKRSQI